MTQALQRASVPPARKQAVIDGTGPSFADLGVPTVLVSALARLDITHPFPIQQATLPVFSRGSNRGSCDSLTNVETSVADSPTAGSTYRWDTNQYIYNFSTKGLSTGEYRVYADLGEGSKRYVDICLTK